MNDPVNSPVLANVIAKSEITTDWHFKYLSAERLFITLINYCQVLPNFVKSNAKEFAPFTDLIRKNNINMQQLLSMLKDYGDVNTAVSEESYMNLRLAAAKAAAVRRNSQYIMLSDLISAVLQTPAPALSRALAQCCRTAPSGKKNTMIEDDIDFGGTDGVSDEYEEDIPEKNLTADPADNGAVKNYFSVLTNRAKKMQQILLRTVFGQDNAVKQFVEGYFRGELLSVTDKKRTAPASTFLFAGPPGVGKTLLAEKAAELLDYPVRRFDMSEYISYDSAQSFCGYDASFQNASPGDVTEFVKDNPKSVIIFDEIEKAHLNVIHLFLQILDSGRLKDNYTDEEVSFSDTIIIFTTNAGRQLYENPVSSDLSSFSRKVILNALEKDTDPHTNKPFFPAAICSRFAAGNVVMFNRMEPDTLCRIARNEFKRHAGNFEDELKISVEADDKVYSALLFSEGGNADARAIRSRAEAFFCGEIFELFRMVEENVPQGISGIKRIRFSVELPEGNSGITGLFQKESGEKDNILVFSSERTADMCRQSAPDCNFMGASDVKEACEVINKNEISFAVVDICWGRKAPQQYLNVEDESSGARDLLKCLRENYCDLPVYILQTNGEILSFEEQLSFKSQGIRGILTLPEKNRGDFRHMISMICASLYQQRSMQALARSNKIVTFSSAQRLLDNGSTAEILLFDFKTCKAVDAEDAGSILDDVSRPNVRFDDIIGAEDAKKELRYFVEYLRNPKKYLTTGISAPRGVILYGPPGTGKTMLAKAMANESDVTFIAAEGNQFLKKYVGESPESVHRLFAAARKYAPTVLFIDEIDSIGKVRNGSELNVVREEVLTAFLTEMDGFKRDVTKPVFVLAATNFDAESNGKTGLDPALVRRFDRRIYIDLPDRSDRLKYMRQKIADNPAFAVSSGKLDNIAVRSTGMSLAQLESVFGLALRTAIRDGNFKVTDEIFDEAFEIFNNGEIKKWDASLLERTARHESGHAFISWLTGSKPSYVTVIARGDHGGYMQHSDGEDKLLFTKNELLERICISLGGRAAEIVYYGEEEGISTGAGSDLVSATRYARQIVCDFGMDDDIGLAVIDHDRSAGGELPTQVNAAVNRILSEQMRKATEIISANKAAVDALTGLLMSKNHLSGNEIDEVFRNTAVCK